MLIIANLAVAMPAVAGISRSLQAHFRTDAPDTAVGVVNNRLAP